MNVDLRSHAAVTWLPGCRARHPAALATATGARQRSATAQLEVVEHAPAARCVRGSQVDPAATGLHQRLRYLDGGPVVALALRVAPQLPVL